MLRKRALQTLKKHARVTSRAGRFKARIGDVAVIIRDRGGELSSVMTDDISWVESFLAGGDGDEALMDWLEGHGGKLAETIRIARQPSTLF